MECSQSSTSEALADVLEKLCLEELADDWVQDIWDAEFMDDIPPPLEYEQHLVSVNTTVDTIIKTIEEVKRILSQVLSTEDEESWKTLVTVMKPKKLIALLLHFINKGEANVNDKKDRLCAINSASLYFIMLAVPGSQAYSVYHVQMFVACLKIFKFANKIVIDNHNFNDKIACIQANSTNLLLKQSLEDLIVLVDNFNLKCNKIATEEAVSCLIDLMNNVQLHSRLHIDKRLLEEINKTAYNSIDMLIESVDDPDKFVILTIFKYILQKLAESNKSASIFLFSSKTSAYNYCKIMIDKYGASAIDGFMCLLQHLCCETVERSDTKLFRVKLIVGLLSFLPIESYSKHLKWLIKLSRSHLPNWRSVALEVIGYIMAGNERNEEESEANDNDEMEIDIAITHNVAHKDLLKVVVERCQDVSCTVRLQAFNILVVCTSAHNPVNSVVKELYGNNDDLLNIAVQRSKDERANVRRSAIKLLNNILRTREELLTQTNLQHLVVLCRDASIIVRTTAIQCLTNLASHWRNTTIAESWLDGSLYQLNDPEAKVQEIVLDTLKLLLFNQIVPYTQAGFDRFPWILMNTIVKKNMRKQLNQACLLLSKQNYFESTLVESVLTHARTENNFYCWGLLSSVARYTTIKNISFVFDYYNERSTDPMFADTRLVILLQEILYEWSKFLSIPQRESLKDGLIEYIRSESAFCGSTQSAVNLAMKLSQNNDYSWATQIMTELEEKITSYFESEDRQSDNIIDNTIIAFGDVCLASPKKPSVEIFNLLVATVNQFDSENAVVTTCATSIIALGKLSLKDPRTAVIVARMCADLLSNSECPLTLRINSMCLLADLSIRFTSIVEAKLSGMYLCLASPDLVLRRMATQLITQLLVSEFLKFRGTLYYNYFTLICDPDEKIRDIATYYVTCCLVARDKTVLYNNFVNAVFRYNNYKDPYYQKYDLYDKEMQLFSLEGEEKRSSRYLIYDIMLNNMTNLQRLNTQVRLCNQALTAGEAGTVSTDVLRDVLDILKKISHVPNKDNHDDMEKRVEANIVTRKMRSNDIERVVPLVMKLYHQLKMNKSPLVLNVISYACDLLNKYKNEIDRLISIAEYAHPLSLAGLLFSPQIKCLLLDVKFGNLSFLKGEKLITLTEEVFEADIDFLSEIKRFQANASQVVMQSADGITVKRRASKTPARLSTSEPSCSTSKKSLGASETPKRKSMSGRQGDNKRRLNLNQQSDEDDSD